MNTQQLKELSKEFSQTLAAHKASPRDYEKVEAWDKATAELSRFINGREEEVIALLCERLEAACIRLDAESCKLRDRAKAAECANAAQDDHINQQQTRIDWLEAANSGLGKALGVAKKELARL